MEKHSVVPDVIDIVPPDSVQVKYPSGVEVKDGNELTPTQVKDQPEVNFKADKNSFYTLIMTDPDAPSRENPEFREILHWLVVNIPGNEVNKGKVITEYIGSGPPQGSGLHRYIFFVFKQPSVLNFDEPGDSRTSRQHRRQFKTRDLAKKYNLGHPVAGNLYQAQYDDYVPILHKQLSG